MTAEAARAPSTMAGSVAAQDALSRAADDALYAAKRRGRDQTFVTPAMATGLLDG